MLHRLVLILSIALAVSSGPLSASCQKLTEKPQLGRVEVLVFDNLGHEVKPSSVSLSGPGLPTWKSPDPVPYGEYTLRITADVFHTVERLVRVDQPEQVVRVQLVFAGLEDCGDAYSGLHGTIAGLSPNQELWIKAVPVRGTGGGEARVGRYGNFLIGGLDPGTYVLLVMEGSRVLRSTVVETGEKVVAIDLNTR